jgi:hypothetical protein
MNSAELNVNAIGEVISNIKLPDELDTAFGLEGNERPE